MTPHGLLLARAAAVGSYLRALLEGRAESFAAALYLRRHAPLTAADEAEPGQPIRIRLTSGEMVEGRVCAPHFYDPENARQEM